MAGLRLSRIKLPVIVLDSRGSGADLAVRAVKAGAVDFLAVPYAQDVLALAGVRVSAEQDGLAQVARERIGRMSERERAVLRGLLAGGTNRTIAKGPRTVELHRVHVMERLGVRTLPEAALMAAEAGHRPPVDMRGAEEGRPA